MQTRAETYALGATGAQSGVNCYPGDSVALQLSGTFVGTVALEGTVDGTNYTAIGLTPAAGGAVVTSLTAAGIATATNVAAFRAVRVNCTAFTSGSIVTTLAFGIAGR
jgi:hypothetical protein